MIQWTVRLWVVWVGWELRLRLWEGNSERRQHRTVGNSVRDMVCLCKEGAGRKKQHGANGATPTEHQHALFHQRPCVVHCDDPARQGRRPHLAVWCLVCPCLSPATQWTTQGHIGLHHLAITRYTTKAPFHNVTHRCMIHRTVRQAMHWFILQEGVGSKLNHHRANPTTPAEHQHSIS